MNKSGTPANLTPWPKGVSGNPAGSRPQLPQEVRAERRRNQNALISLISKMFSLKPEDMQRNLERPEITQLELAVQGMIDKAKEGDTNAFKYLIEVICGKIPEQDYESAAEQMTAQEKLELMRRAVATLEGQIHGSGSAQPPG